MYPVKVLSVGVENAPTFWTDSVAEIGLSVLPNIQLQWPPSPFLIPNLSARGAHGKQSAQSFDMSERVLEFMDQSLPFCLCRLALTDVANDQTSSSLPLRILKNNG